MKMFDLGGNFIGFISTFGDFLYFCWMSNYIQWKRFTREIFTFVQKTGKLKFYATVDILKLRSVCYLLAMNMFCQGDIPLHVFTALEVLRYLRFELLWQNRCYRWVSGINDTWPKRIGADLFPTRSLLFNCHRPQISGYTRSDRSAFDNCDVDVCVTSLFGLILATVKCRARVLLVVTRTFEACVAFRKPARLFEWRQLQLQLPLSG